MLRTVLVSLVMLASPALAQSDAQSDLERSKVLGGVAGIVYAEEVCDFDVDSDALMEYLEERDLLSPEAMVEMNAAVLVAQATKPELTELQCAMNKATADEMDVLDD